jgi:hypothetical protein
MVFEAFLEMLRKYMNGIYDAADTFQEVKLFSLLFHINGSYASSHEWKIIYILLIFMGTKYFYGIELKMAPGTDRFLTFYSVHIIWITTSIHLFFF